MLFVCVPAPRVSLNSLHIACRKKVQGEKTVFDRECSKGERQAFRCCGNKAPGCEDDSIWGFSNTGALLPASFAVRGARSCFLSFPILSLPGPTSCCFFHQLLLCSSCSPDRWHQSSSMISPPTPPTSPLPPCLSLKKSAVRCLQGASGWQCYSPSLA